MPYIKSERRVELLDDNLIGAQNAGELNFVLTVLVNEYIEDAGANYQAMNDVIGALEACKLELYRRRVAPYEDVKIKENGDVGYGNT